MLFQLLKKIIFLLIFFAFTTKSFPNFILQLKIIGTENEKVELSGFYGAENFKISEIKKNSANTYRYTIEKGVFYEGFYRISINDTLIYDFIVTRNDSIYLEVDIRDFKNTFKLTHNINNELLLKLKKELSQVNTILNNVQKINGDSITNASVQLYIFNLQTEKNSIIEEYCKKFNSPVFRSLSRMNKDVLPDSTGAIREEDFFSDFNLNDSCVKHTNLFPSRIIDYFAKFTDLDETTFKIAVNRLLFKAKNNNSNYDFTLYFLLQLFGEVGPEVIFQYVLSEHYVKNTCDLEIKNNDLAKRIQKFTSLLPGNTSPILIANSIKGKEIKLTDVTKLNTTTILFFWNPDCHFCKELIPKLKQEYKKYKKKGIEIVSFAITTDKLAWGKMSDEFKFPWKDISDLKGWDSPIVTDFMVTKSPFLILINSNNIITKFDFSTEFLNRL